MTRAHRRQSHHRRRPTARTGRPGPAPALLTALLLTALLLTALLLTACSPADDLAAAPDDRAVIDVTLFGEPAEIAAYTALVEAFESGHPDIDVVLNPVASQGDLLANLTTSFAGGQPPDVFLANYLRYGQFAAQGVLADVQPYLDASDAISEADFAEPPLEAFRFDGETLTCMPQNISSLEVYYNVDLFQAAGLDAPVAGWTWDDFLGAAQALTDPATGTWGVGVEPSIQRIAPFVWSAGGELVDDQDTPTTLTLDDEAARVGLDFVLDLALVHEVVPPDAEEQSLEAEERFIAGRLGMYLNSRAPVPTLREGIGDAFTWDVAPLPVAPGGVPTTVLHGDAYCLAADGAPDLAWRLVEFAMGREGQEILARSGRTVPSRLDVASSAAFLEPDEPPASSHVFVDAIPTIRSLPHTATWSQMQNMVDEVLADVFYGRTDRDQGIAEAIAAAEAIFAQER
jgi:multiple sugar transport system substrate-binding protein